MNKNKDELKNFNFKEFEKEAIKGLYEKKPLTGKDGILTPLIKRLLEASLKAELDSHMEDTRDNGNRKNGYTSKTIKTDTSEIELDNPRDREGSFQPQIIKKRQRILPEDIERGILSLYKHGNSYQDIIDFYEEKYGVQLSKGTINSITEQVLPLITEWQSRPLDSVYPFVWLDAMFVKVREDGKVITKSLYCVVGINCEGIKEVLSIYLSEAEGARFWLQILTDLSNRGVKDILIASIDGLKGFPEAIQSTFPKTEVQLCIVHQIRNSLKYVTWKDYKAFLKDLKKVYQAATKEIAEDELNALEEIWGKKYPVVIKSWRNNWENLSNYFKYPEAIRKMIYTTNIIEGFHRQLRKIIKTKGAFSSEDALFKLTYLAIQDITKKWSKPPRHWRQTLSQLAIIFEDRMIYPLKN
jgi:transposase-like protein